MNYLNVLILSLCGVLFTVYFFACTKRLDPKGILFGLVCLCLLGFYMLDFQNFLHGGVEEQTRIISLKQGGYRATVIDIVTDSKQKYWGSFSLFKSKIAYGSMYTIAYLPRTKALLSIKEIHSYQNNHFIYHYKNDYWISFAIIAIFLIIIIISQLRLHKRYRKSNRKF